MENNIVQLQDYLNVAQSYIDHAKEDINKLGIGLGCIKVVIRCLKREQQPNEDIRKSIEEFTQYYLNLEEFFHYREDTNSVCVSLSIYVDSRIYYINLFSVIRLLQMI